MPTVTGFLRSVREKGIAVTLHDSGRWLYWKGRTSAFRYRWLYRGKLFDASMGTDTSAWKLGLRRNMQGIRQRISSPSRDDITGFFAIEPVLGKKILSDLPIGYSEFTFVDVGSGTGRAMLIASLFPFRRIIGVELSSELNEIAQKNLSRCNKDKQKCKDVAALLADACAYEFPPEPLVIFMYNPFGEKTMSHVIGNLIGSFRECPRPILIVYWRPRLHSLLMDTGFLEHIQTYETFFMNCHVYRSISGTQS
jgi:SAM-dependent methyltransferase